MAYIQQPQQHQQQHQSQTTSGGGQGDSMSGAAFEVQIQDASDPKHHMMSLPIDSARDPASNSQSRIEHMTGQQQQQRHDDSDGPAENSANNHQSSSTSSVDEQQHNSDRQSDSHNASGSLEAGVVSHKTPNSYKFPMLRRYFDFGPWVGRNRKALCLACHLQSSSSQPDRLLKHLNRCNALSENDKLEVAELMNERTANKRKRPSQVKHRRDNDNDSEYYGDDDPSGSANDLSLSGLNTGHGVISIPPGGLKKPRREHTDRKSQIDEALTRFIVMCRIPLKAIHSKEFIDFIRALDPEYHIPSRETITNVLIPGLLNII